MHDWYGSGGLCRDGFYAVGSVSYTHLDVYKRQAFHVSGGTTEALLVSPDDQRILSCQLAAKTLDLNAGQLIDRVRCV